jgi:hypothetical protein
MAMLMPPNDWIRSASNAPSIVISALKECESVIAPPVEAPFGADKHSHALLRQHDVRR